MKAVSRNSSLKRIFIFVVGILVFGMVILAISYFIKLPVLHNTDFFVLYFSNRSMLNGIHLYDYPAQVEYIRSLTQTDQAFLPYPYPPWYALSTFYLALFPIDVASRVWFLLNLMMISLSVGLLTFKWKLRHRIYAILLASLFVPVLGLLMVGQYSVPVLLGVSILFWALQKESALGTALAMGLLTFKPHLGIIVGITTFIWLVYYWRKRFARCAIVLTISIAIFLSIIGFIADPVWPLNYIKSLENYREISGVISCGICASFPVMIVELVTDQGNVFQGALVSVFLTAGFAGLFIWQFQNRLRDITLLIVLSIAFTLLVSPYLLSYDFVLLLVMFIVVYEQEHSRLGRLVLIGAYILPWMILTIGRKGNYLLIISTLSLLYLFWVSQMRNPMNEFGEDIKPDM
jgi:hypothetical protein